MNLTIKFKLTSPLSHIGETASTGSYFQTILTSEGRLPVVTANSIRGQIRDSGAIHLLDTLGCKVDKEVFHLLFSGGNLNGSMKNDIGKANDARNYFPLVSVLGGGLGDQILAGKMNLTFAYPICFESYPITKIESELSWHKLIEEIEYTRTDDSKNDKLSKYIVDIGAEQSAKATTQMRYSVQYMAAGAELWQQIKLISATDIEKGALITAILEWFKNPTLGGMASKGFGFFDADINDGQITVINGKIEVCEEFMDLSNKYIDYIKTTDIIPHLDLLKGVKTVGKGKNKAIESDSEVD